MNSVHTNDAPGTMQRLTSIVDRHARAAFAGLAIVTGAMSLLLAHARTFWHDEIYSVEIAKLPTLGTIWRVLRSGADNMPPLNVALLHMEAALTPLTETTARLPSLASYLILLVVVFETVRRRASGVAGLSAALMLSLSGAFPFSYEARGYALMLACASLALLSWTEAASGPHRLFWLPMLAGSFAAAVWSHYFGALIGVPIVVGECVRTFTRRRIDTGVWIAILSAAALVVPLVPMLIGAAHSAPGYWRAAAWTDLIPAYRLIAGSMLGRRYLVLWGAVGAACLVAIAARRGTRWQRVLPPHEIVAYGVAAVLPLLAVGIGVVLGAFVPRYAIIGVIGLCVGVPIAVWVADAGAGAIQLLLCVGLLIVCIRPGWLATALSARLEDNISNRTMLGSLTGGTEPIAVTGVAYLEAWYYAAPELRARLTYVADPETSRRLVGSDTLERDYLLFSQFVPIHVESYRSFTGMHRAFKVYAEGEFAWLPDRLREDHAILTRISGNGIGSAFGVEMPR